MNIKIIKNKKVKKILITSMTAVTIINSSPISIFADNEGNKVGEPNIVNNKLTNTENKDQTDDTSSKSDETELNHALNVDEKDADIKNDKSTNLENKDNINDTNPKFDETELNYALNADEKDADIKNDKSTNTENKDNINDANPKSNKTEIKATGTLVEIPDNNLKAELNKKIGQADGLPIYSSQLEQIRGKLTIVKKDIQNLEGIQYCTNIQELDLRNNNISDLSPLGSLTNLQYLNLDNNKLSNIGPLGSLTNLNALYLGNNKINDISPLSSLTNLNTLGLGNNKLDDISSLSSLSKLKTLYLQSNIISNISSLSSLTSLNTLNLNNNKINNVKPLSSLINLKTLTLDNNYIINIRDLKVLSNLTKLSISGQKHILESKDALYKKKFKIENPIIDTNGFVSNITQISDNGRYNNLDSSIEWENLTNDKNLTFSFDKNISIGHASGVFSGTVTQPVKISKSSYNVTYDSNGGSNVSQESVEEESLIQKPADPTKEGYTFAGWYTDETFKTEWNFDTDKMPSKDITLYAKWNVNNYNVTYDSNGGTSVPQESVDYNAKVSKPADPTKEGYTFAGWYTDETFKTEWNFDTDKMPSKDITLYAKWNVNNYNVTYDSNGGTSVPQESVDYNAKVSRPT
ncbi:InlB B-repeat-containing protein, partial [Paraclostridium sordellii]|uniref:InlB B-repeat-containing protein n=1 Tax=Paraclostridium sordellii TaxID=1505 RepID=UPI0018CF2104